MQPTIHLNPGEIKLNFDEVLTGRVTFQRLGLPNQHPLPAGQLRLVFNLDGLPPVSWYQMPTIEVSYAEEVGETHWQVDFNGEMILDKYDHHGHATVLLLSRKELEARWHRHENRLIVHAEFPQGVHLDPANSYVNLFK